MKTADELNNKENFAFSRYSDGELYILQNKELVLDNGVIQIGDVKEGGVWGVYTHPIWTVCKCMLLFHCF